MSNLTKFVVIFLFWSFTVGCVGTFPEVIQNGKIVSEWDIVNNNKFQTFNDNQSEIYNKAEQFRLDHLNTFKFLYGHKRK